MRDLQRSIELLEWQIRDARKHKTIDRERCMVMSSDVEAVIAALREATS